MKTALLSIACALAVGVIYLFKIGYFEHLQLDRWQKDLSKKAELIVAQMNQDPELAHVKAHLAKGEYALVVDGFVPNTNALERARRIASRFEKTCGINFRVEEPRLDQASSNAESAKPQ